jgi:hypothetical protein
MHSPGNGLFHQMMVGRVIHHCIETVTIAIMCLQNRLARIGVETPLDDLFPPGKGPNCTEMLLCPGCSLALHACDQGAIRGLSRQNRQ